MKILEFTFEVLMPWMIFPFYMIVENNKHKSIRVLMFCLSICSISILGMFLIIPILAVTMSIAVFSEI
jgi:hypothetical protein